MGQKPEDVNPNDKKKTGEEKDYTKEFEEVRSGISGLRTDIKDALGRLGGPAEEKGAEEEFSECPECYEMVKPENMVKHVRKELEPKIRDELKPKVRKELEPKIREELKEELKPEKEVKEVPKLIPQTEFRKTIGDTLDEYKKDKVDELKPGILEVEKILSNAGLIKSEGEK